MSPPRVCKYFSEGFLMARPNPIRAIMESPLPSITYQRRKQFRPTHFEIICAYNSINRYIFDNQLRKPEITTGQIRHAWGQCSWLTTKQYTGSYCTIWLADKWFCPQWFIQTLAHEMVHQYQWDIYRWEHLDCHGREMHLDSGGHGPSFFMWRDRFADYGMLLKQWFGQKRWFTHQDFTKC